MNKSSHANDDTAEQHAIIDPVLASLVALLGILVLLMNALNQFQFGGSVC
jgi:hypothetical protein